MSLKKRNRGQSTVEFAIVALIAFLILLVLAEGSRLLFTYTLLSDATRVGARTAVLPDTLTHSTVASAVVSTAGAVPGLTTSHVTVLKNGTTINPSPGTLSKVRGDTMTVRTAYTFTFLAGGLFPFSSRVITTETDMRAEG
jgi:Flp pilus assembly protein TadG